MTSRMLVLAVAATLAVPSPHAWAEDRRNLPQQGNPPVSASRGATIGWTTAGAAAGFGVGLWLGLNAFDQALYSDRKVWTSAIAGAAVGALAGVLVARARRHATPSPSVERPLANDDAALTFARTQFASNPLLAEREADGESQVGTARRTDPHLEHRP